MNAVWASDVGAPRLRERAQWASQAVVRSTAAGIFAGSLALMACGDRAGADVAADASAVVTDSAGIALVSYATLDLSSLEQWEIGDEPVAILGDDGRGEEHQFGFVNGVVRLSDGRLIVALEESEILAFDSAGNFLSRFARKGRGPGEFTTLFGLHRIRGDTLLAYQHFPESVTLFDSSGAYVRTALLVRPTVQQEYAELAAFEFRSVFPDGSLLVNRHGGERDIKVGEVHSDSVRRLRIAPTGAVLADFGTRWDKDQTRVRIVAAANGMAVPSDVASMPHVMRAASWGVVGNRFYYSTGDEFSVEFWSADGQLQRIVRVATERIPAASATPGEILWKGVRYQSEEPTRLFDPPINRPRADYAGNLWVGVHPRALRDSTVHYIVFDSTGIARAAVRWKTRFTRDTRWTLVGNWQQIDEHTFTTVAMDRDDRFQVLVLPIAKSARP